MVQISLYSSQILWCLGGMFLTTGFIYFIAAPRLENTLAYRELLIRQNLQAAKQLADKASQINDRISEEISKATEKAAKLVEHAALINSEYYNYRLKVINKIFKTEEAKLVLTMTKEINKHISTKSSEVISLAETLGSKIFNISFNKDKKLDNIVKNNLNDWQISSING